MLQWPGYGGRKPRTVSRCLSRSALPLYHPRPLLPVLCPPAPARPLAAPLLPPAACRPNPRPVPAIVSPHRSKDCGMLVLKLMAT